MTVISQLLVIEIAVKGIIGGLLLLFPRTLARVLGLAPVADTFWARMLGVTLLGLAAATLLEVRLGLKGGLGLSGHVALNLLAALAIFALIILGRAAPERRGRWALGLMAAAMTLLALVEMAWI